MRRALHRATIVVIATIAGCATAPDRSATTADPESNVGTRLTQALKVALEAGDAGAVAGIFAVDGVAMPPHHADIEGREAIRNFYRELFTAYAMQIEPIVVETRLHADHGYARGTYRLKMTPKDGGAAITDEGRYLTLLQRHPDGTWQVTREMTNSSAP